MRMIERVSTPKINIPELRQKEQYCKPCWSYFLLELKYLCDAAF
jgi:hypothetical protein